MRTLSEYKSMQNRSPSLRVSHQIQIHRSSRQKSRSKFLSHLLFWRELGWIWNWRLTRRSGLLWLYLERLRMRFLRNFAKKIWHLPPPSFVERVYSTKFLTHLLFWRELRWIWIWWLTRRLGDLFCIELYSERVRMCFLRNFEVRYHMLTICSSKDKNLSFTHIDMGLRENILIFVYSVVILYCFRFLFYSLYISSLL